MCNYRTQCIRDINTQQQQHTMDDSCTRQLLTEEDHLTSSLMKQTNNKLRITH